MLKWNQVTSLQSGTTLSDGFVGTCVLAKAILSMVNF